MINTRKLKIGVMTFWDTKDNYGQLLQAYGLQIYLKDRGHSPYVVRFRKDTNRKEKKGGQSMLSAFLKRVRKGLMSVKSKSRFDERRDLNSFRNKFLDFSPQVYDSLNDLRASPPLADLYITGSDQVWNHSFNGEPEAYFLRFGDPEVKRISYAASFGHRELPEDIEAQYKEWMQGLDLIGVRENSGQELCKQLGFESTLLPDPTLLLGKETWLSIAQPSNYFDFDKSLKIFGYLLGNRPSNTKDDLLNYLSGKIDSSLVLCTINKDSSGTAFPNMHEWLGLINESHLVVTNSFHGMVFSILLNKNFIVVPSSGLTEGMNERLTSLLDRLGLLDHLLFEFDPKKVESMILRSVDWSLVNRKIEDFRKEADVFMDAVEYNLNKN